MCEVLGNLNGQNDDVRNKTLGFCEMKWDLPCNDTVGVALRRRFVAIRELDIFIFDALVNELLGRLEETEESSNEIH